MSLTNDNTLLQVNNLKKYFPTPHGLIYANDDRMHFCCLHKPDQ